MDKPFDLVIKNARVVRPNKTSVDCLDIAVRDGKIDRIAPNIRAEQGKEIFDAQNYLAFPGCVDAHMHVGIYQPLAEDAASESKAAAMDGVTSFKIFMFYGGYGLHGRSNAQNDFLMIGPEERYDIAHFEFIMRSARRLMTQHPKLADYISVSLHCELAEILNAYTRIVEREGKLTGLHACSAARPPHSEGLAIWIASYLANETDCLNINLLHLSSRKAVD